MSLCINPHCSSPQNPDNILFCQACGSELLLEGRYRVINILGGGGFGKTFAVSDVRTTIPKVLKVLINDHPKAVELFQREAEVLGQLHHPGIPQVDADGYFTFLPRNSQETLHCLVMEKIEGLDLEKYSRQRGDRPIEQKLAVQWLTEILQILQQVHSQQFFHRDIKPSNIMLRADGRLALIDFGTARAVTGTYVAKQAVGQVTGVISAGYTPPEQFNGQAVPQSDFYALARTFVFLLTGQDPSQFYDPMNDELHWRDKTTNITPEFATILEQMMARVVSQRPQNAEAILQKLAPLQQSTSQIPATTVAGTQQINSQPPTPANNHQQINPTITTNSSTQVDKPPTNKKNLPIVIGASVISTFILSFIVFQTLPKTTSNSISDTIPSPETTSTPELINPFIAQANKARQAEARNYLGAMNRGQQAYFLEYSKFASTIDELQIGIKNSEHYSYNVEVISPTEAVRITATAEQAGLKSYTGAVFIYNKDGDSLTFAMICESDTPTFAPPPMPELNGENTQCPAGSSTLSR
ncbi:MAG TPA: type IV pilin-like G/H family protein [Nostocaceae cyanobacterium]|nr:type IV pilin-like G/H family protein [Nostocaceae cyanobacterium]